IKPQSDQERNGKARDRLRPTDECFESRLFWNGHRHRRRLQRCSWPMARRAVRHAAGRLAGVAIAICPQFGLVEEGRSLLEDIEKWLVVTGIEPATPCLQRKQNFKLS